MAPEVVVDHASVLRRPPDQPVGGAAIAQVVERPAGGEQGAKAVPQQGSQGQGAGRAGGREPHLHGLQDAVDVDRAEGTLARRRLPDQHLAVVALEETGRTGVEAALRRGQPFFQGQHSDELVEEPSLGSHRPRRRLVGQPQDLGAGRVLGAGRGQGHVGHGVEAVEVGAVEDAGVDLGLEHGVVLEDEGVEPGTVVDDGRAPSPEQAMEHGEEEKATQLRAPAEEAGEGVSGPLRGGSTTR